MIEIPLTKGFFVQVDDWNYDWLNKYKWYAAKGVNTWYAAHVSSNSTGHKTILMHRVIMKTPKHLDVDHIDNNGLNCLESNMRNATRSQNCTNRIYKNKTGYRGVFPAYNKFHARISIKTTKKYLGTYDTAILAAKAYDVAAIKYYGEFAILNFN